MFGRDSSMSEPREDTRVKFPPTTIWSPTSANAHTAPSSTVGFCLGTSDTTLLVPGGRGRRRRTCFCGG